MTKAIPKHGGNIYKEAEKLGFRPEELLDFSANINPLGIPPNLKEHLRGSLEGCINYPDPDSTELKGKLGAYTGLSPSNICVGNGALDLLYMLFHALKIKRVVIPAPSFNEYEKAAGTSGADVVYHERLERAGFKLNFDELLSFTLENNADAVLICNPNNPTSTAEKAEELVRFIGKAAENNIIVITDEAFAELTKNIEELTVAPFVNKYINLYVIRAFTKYFGIPGLRLGYCLSAKENISSMEEIQPSWPINTLASQAGIVFDIDKEYISKTKGWIRIEPDYLYNELCQIQEIKAYPPETNFILCKLTAENWNAERLGELFIKDRILIRNAGNFPFLDNTYFRLAVKDRKSNEKLIETLKNIKWR